MNRNSKFNRLTFIKLVDKPTYITKCENFGKFRCECGRHITARLWAVKNGHTKSCGCLQKEKLKIAQAANRGGYGESCKKYVLYQVKRGATIRNLSFTLTDDEALSLTKQNCYYCDAPPSMKRKGKCHYGEYVYNGLDRVNNLIGYELNNVVSCCIICNRMKMAHTKDKFLKQIKNIYENLHLNNSLS